MAYNICYTTYIPEEYWHLFPEGTYNEISIDCTDETNPDDDDDNDDILPKMKGRKGTYTFRFIKKTIIHGILPQKVKEIVTERHRVRDQMNTETDPVKKRILNARQNALKVTANSFYGFLGVLRNGKRPFREAAVAITAWGRKLIIEVNDYLVKTYNAKIIYGDTDSTMVQLPQIKDKMDAWYWADRIAEETTALSPPEIIMEAENVYGIFLSIMKKKYATVAMNRKGELAMNSDGTFDIKVKGALSARRDNCQWARTTYNELLQRLFQGKPFFEIVDYALKCCGEVLDGKIDHMEFVTTRSIRDNYKSKTYMLAVFADNMRKNGTPPEPGERVRYLIIDNGNTRIGDKMVTLQAYENSLQTDTPYKIDTLYYIEGMIGSHVDQLIRIVFSHIKDSKPYLCFKRSKACRKYHHLTEPVSLLSQCVKGGKTINDLRYAVELAKGGYCLKDTIFSEFYNLYAFILKFPKRVDIST